MSDAAVLARVREKHCPVRAVAGLICGGCDLSPFPPWPCSTAELVYTADEIGKLKEDK